MSNTLDVISSSVYFAAHRKLKDSETLALVESAIYCLTVDMKTEMLQVKRIL